MRYALILAAVVGISAALPAAADEVGVGVGPVSAQRAIATVRSSMIATNIGIGIL